MRRLFSSVAVKVQVSDEHVTTGLIIVLYIFILVFLFRKFEFISFALAWYALLSFTILSAVLNNTVRNNYVSRSALFRDITQRNSLPTFQDNLSVPSSNTKKSWISWYLKYVGKELTLYAV